MSKGTVNKVILIGNLGRAPQVKTATTGTTIANLAIATTGSWKDKNTGEAKENTEWHRIVLYGKLAEIADKYLEKGSKVYIEGRLQTRKWEKEGKEHYTTEVICESLQMLNFKSSDKEEPQEKISDNRYSVDGLDDDIPW